MNKTNIFWTITLTRGEYHQHPHVDGKWFDYLNLAFIISQRTQDFLSPCLHSAGNFPCFLACSKCSEEKRERDIWHLSTHFLSSLCYALTMILVLEYQNVTQPPPSGIRDWNKGKICKILFTENWYLKGVKTYFIFMTNWLSFMASHSLCGGEHIVNVRIFDQYALLCILVYCVWWRKCVHSRESDNSSLQSPQMSNSTLSTNAKPC